MLNIIKTRFKAFRANGSFPHIALKYARDENMKLPNSFKPHVAGLRDEAMAVYQPQLLGFRIVGFSDEISIYIKHEGWYADHFEDDLYRGVVFQLSGKKGETRYVIGYHERDSDYYIIIPEIIGTSDNDYIQGDGLKGTVIAQKAAYAADIMAKRAAEKSRENDSAFRIGEDIAELIKENKRLRREIKQGSKELKRLRNLSPDFDIQAPITVQHFADCASQRRDTIYNNNKKIAEYKRGNHPEFSIYVTAELRHYMHDSIGNGL